MPLEVVPDLLDRIEFGCVAGEALEVKPGKGIAHRVDGRPLVNLPAIPEQDDGSTQVGEQQTQEPGHVHGFEVVLSKLKVETQAGTLGRNREGRDGRDPVVLVVVAHDRRASSRAPRPTARRDEHEAALIEEDDVGAKPSGFFLLTATCAASSARWLLRRAGSRGVRALGNSTRTPEERARGGSGGSGPRTSCGRAWRCASTSTARWESRTLSPPRAAASATSRAAWRSVSRAGPEWAWPSTPHRHAASSPAASDARLRERLEPDGRPPESHSHSLTTPRLDGDASPGSLLIRWVSCSIVSPRSIIYAILNNRALCSHCGIAQGERAASIERDRSSRARRVNGYRWFDGADDVRAPA